MILNKNIFVWKEATAVKTTLKTVSHCVSQSFCNKCTKLKSSPISEGTGAEKD